MCTHARMYYQFNIIIIGLQILNVNAIIAMYSFIEGFIQPAFVEKMVLADDPAGFVDWQLFDFPPERDTYLDDLKVPVPDDVPELERVLKVSLSCIHQFFMVTTIQATSNETHACR